MATCKKVFKIITRGGQPPPIFKITIKKNHMKSIYDFTATEIKNILTEKNIQHEYVVGNYDQIWIGIRAKTCYNWLKFYDENSSMFGAEIYSQNTGKTAKGFRARFKVYDRFLKLIN